MFFYDLGLGVIICCFSIFVYKYSSYYLKDKRYQQLLFSFLLVGMTGLLLLYTRSEISLVFWDIPIILSYLKNREKEAVFLSIFITILLIISTSISPFILILKFLLYLISYCCLQRKRHLLIQVLFIEKAFFLALICFMRETSNIPLLFLYLFMIIVFLYLFIHLIISFLNLKSNNFLEEKIEIEKKVFRITHEIKNPLAVCKGYLDMIDINEKEKLERYLSIVRSEMDRALIIMDDFLSLSNISIRKEILDLYLLIEDVGETMALLLREKQVILEIPNYDSELYIIGDFDRLKQVLMNLIKNSYEAEANCIKIDTTVIKNKVKIEIKDNGKGISSHDLKRIGEIFFTTKSNGSGIGINLSKEIISLHNGEIQYQSKEQEGTIVTIILPIEKGIN